MDLLLALCSSGRGELKQGDGAASPQPISLKLGYSRRIYRGWTDFRNSGRASGDSSRHRRRVIPADGSDCGRIWTWLTQSSSRSLLLCSRCVRRPAEVRFRGWHWRTAEQIPAVSVQEERSTASLRETDF